MLLLAISLAALAQFLISSFVLVRGRNNLSYIFFFMIGISTMMWSLANFYSLEILNTPRLINIVRLVLFFVVFQNSSFYLFAKTFPSTSWKHSKLWLSLYLIFSTLTATLTLSPYVFTEVNVENGLANTIPGPGIIIFVVHAVISIFTAFWLLIKKYKSARGPLKSQLKVLLIAAILLWVVVPLTNFVFTPATGSTYFVTFSPVYSLFFSAMIAYAIVVERLFDMRLIIVRSVAYIFSIGLLAILFALASSLLINSVLNEVTNAYIETAVNTLILTIAVVSFPPIQRFFNSLTNRIFYRESYDSKLVLNSLSEIVIDEIDLDKLLKRSLDLIVPTFGAFSGSFELNSKTDPSKNYNKLLKSQHNSIFVLNDANAGSSIGKLLKQIDFEVSANLSVNRENVGFLLLGRKRNGTIYNAQDISLISFMISELSIAIQNSQRFEEIKDLNASLEQRIEIATKELKSSNERLVKLDEAKDEFISMASHQLRTPLTSVKGYISMVLEGDAGKINPQQSKLLDQAYISSQRMVYLIADLLNVSRIHTGKFALEKSPTNLADLIEGEISQLYGTLGSRELNLKYKKPHDFPTLMLDETKIRQVIMNFADNAIYYTRKGGKIEIKLSASDKEVKCEVIDNGIGVPKKEVPHLFTKFYRAKNARKARPDGTGLGLYMAKKVIIAHGGHVIFKTKEGHGSTFGFSLPRAKLEVVDKH